MVGGTCRRGSIVGGNPAYFGQVVDETKMNYDPAEAEVTTTRCLGELARACTR